MQEEQRLCRQQVIDETLPQLIELLLVSEPKRHCEFCVEKTNDLSPDDYESCLNYARNYLQVYGHEECNPMAVSRLMQHFEERFESEQQSEYANTFQQLANVVLNDEVCQNHVQPNMQWRLLEFMLSVNYKVFKKIRTYPTEMEEIRKSILKSLALATNTDDWAAQEAAEAEGQPLLEKIFKSCRDDSYPLNLPEPPCTSFDMANAGGGGYNWHKETSRRYAQNTQSEACGRRQEPDLRRVALDLAQHESKHQRRLGNPKQVKIKENFTTEEAKMDLKLYFQPLETDVEKPTKVNYYRGPHDILAQIQSPGCQVDVHVHSQPRMLASTFNQSYGKRLLYQLRKSRNYLREMDEEHQLMRELVILFFAPVDTDYFQWVNQTPVLRSDDSLPDGLSQIRGCPLLARVLEAIEQMHHLRQFIELHAFPRISGDRLETFTSFSVALRRLLRPVLEFLIYFERRLTQGQETSSLIHFCMSSQKPLDKLNFLYGLFRINDEGVGSVRSLSLLNSLFLASSKASQRSVSASLLLHSLQAYCLFLDNWWKTGDFGDWHDEFPYQRILVEGHTEYVLKEEWNEETGLLDGRLFQVIQSHVKESRQALAVLSDSRQLGDFIHLHGSLFKQSSLHNAFMEAVLQELRPYQTGKLEDIPIAPDILHQLEETEVQAMRQMLYSYHVETKPDPRQPVACSADELLRNFEVCAPYAPLTEIICLELERLLRRRSHLAKCYMLDFLGRELQLSKSIGHLRSVFLLLKYEQQRHKFEEFFGFLQKNLLAEAALWLGKIVASQDQEYVYMFHVIVQGSHPDNVSLMLIYDPVLTRVISHWQVEKLNRCFRLILNLHWTLYKERKLPALEKEIKVVKELESLRSELKSLLDQQLMNVRQIQQFCEVDSSSGTDSSLEELERSHNLIVQQAEEQLKVVSGGCSLEQLLYLSRILNFLWRTAATLTKVQEEKGRKPKAEAIQADYLHSILKHCRALKLFLELE